MLEGDDAGGRAFALFLRPHPGHFRQLTCMCPHPWEFSHFLTWKIFIINLENIYYFPSCNGGPISLHHSVTPSLHHSFTPSLHHSITPSLHHSFTPSLHHSNTPSLLHSITPSLPVRHLEIGGGRGGGAAPI